MWINVAADQIHKVIVSSELQRSEKITGSFIFEGATVS